MIVWVSAECRKCGAMLATDFVQKLLRLFSSRAKQVQCTQNARPFMLTREHIVELLRAQSAYLAQEFGVRKIGLFGSFAKGLSTENSDIDLVIEFDTPIGLRFMELGDYLEAMLGRRVDILTPIGLQAIRRKTVIQNITESIIYV